jgi:hypothetical protein
VISSGGNAHFFGATSCSNLPMFPTRPTPDPSSARQREKPSCLLRVRYLTADVPRRLVLAQAFIDDLAQQVVLARLIAESWRVPAVNSPLRTS